MLGFTTQDFGNIHIDLENLASNYEVVNPVSKNYFLNKIAVDSNLFKDNHKPPYKMDIFKPLVQDTISMLAFCLRLDSDWEVGASLFEMVYNIHYATPPIKYNFLEHIVVHICKNNN